MEVMLTPVGGYIARWPGMRAEGDAVDGLLTLRIVERRPYGRGRTGGVDEPYLAVDFGT